MKQVSLDKDKYNAVLNKKVSYIKIHRLLRTKLLAYLKSIGINAYRLMPDLPSVCEAITNDVKNKNKIGFIDI